jgi:tRNA pseudouridine65 synthase
MLEVIYQDDYIIAVNKPYSWIVHWSELISEDEERIVLRKLREQLGRKIYTVHRLDAKTTGVLIFAFKKTTQRKLNKGFAEKQYQKVYWAIVRGKIPDEGEIRSDLTNLKGKTQYAITRYTKLASQSQNFLKYPKFPNGNYSLAELYPVTGRMHQLRKHLSDAYHPIVGDRAHGNKIQNNFFTHQYDYSEMALHSRYIVLPHPTTGEIIKIEAPLHPEFVRLAYICGIKLPEIH